MVLMTNGTLPFILKTAEKNVMTETTLMVTVALQLAQLNTLGSAWMTLATTCGATIVVGRSAATVLLIPPISIRMASRGLLKSVISAHTTVMALSTLMHAVKHARNRAQQIKLIYICGNV